MQTHVVVLVLVAVSLAGCSGETPPSSGGDDLFTGYEPAPEPGKGLLRGIVIDANVMPISDAKVVVVGSDLEVVTDGNGAFQFSDLEPGAYFLDVSKTGYSKVRAQGSVVANVKSPEIVRTQIDLIPGLMPMFVPLSYTLFMRCGFKLANYVFDASSCVTRRASLAQVSPWTRK